MVTETSFRIRLSSSSEELEVPADRSIVEVLRENGHYVDTSCEEGYCGTCLTPYLDGEPEHRDHDEEEQRDCRGDNGVSDQHDVFAWQLISQVARKQTAANTGKEIKDRGLAPKLVTRGLLNESLLLENEFH